MTNYLMALDYADTYTLVPIMNAIGLFLKTVSNTKVDISIHYQLEVLHKNTSVFQNKIIW